MSLENRRNRSGRLCRVDIWRYLVSEVLSTTKFSLAQTEILEISEVRRSVASQRELLTS